MKFDYLIFDCYNFFYKANSGKPERIIKYRGENFHTEGITAFLELADTFIKKYLAKDGKIYWLMDNAKTSIRKLRKSLSEDYKKTRTDEPPWFYRQLDILELILKYYQDDTFLYRIKNIEADDFCPAIIDNFISKDKKVLMISEDMDWCRSLSDNVFQFKDKQIYTKVEFFNKYKFEATNSNICFYKTFYGDDSDNIKPTLSTLPPLFFNEIIKENLNIYGFINLVENNKIKYLDDGWRLNILSKKEEMIVNWELVTAIDLDIHDLNQYQYECKFQPNKLQIIYSDLNIKHIDKRFNTVVKKSDLLDSLLGGEPIERRQNF